MREFALEEDENDDNKEDDNDDEDEDEDGCALYAHGRVENNDLSL